MNLEEETIKWMSSLGFQDNTKADYPNFTFSLKQYLEPDEDMKKVAKINKDFDPIEEPNISLGLAEYFYLKCQSGDLNK